MRPILLLAAYILVIFFSDGLKAQIYEPARGTVERSAILDAVRPAVESETGGAVEFVVERLDVLTPWAYAILHPQRPGGVPITDFDVLPDQDLRDGLTTFALVRRIEDRWVLIDFAVGPTDAFFVGWPDQFGVPDMLLGLQ